MRIVVFGTGGAGGYFGAQLARAGEEVVFIARGDHLNAIRTNGLRIEGPDRTTVIHPAQATDDPTQITGVDAVLLGVKAWQVHEAAEVMRPMMGPATFVVPLQNGVEAAAQLAAVLTPERVLGGLCGTLSWITGAGKIRSISSGAGNFIKFGELDKQPSKRCEQLRQAFERAGVNVEVSADIERALWEKFMLVTSFGGMGAITRAPMGVIRSLPETRRLLQACMQEIDAIARARRIALADTAVADGMKFFDTTTPPNATTSLQRDIVAGKASELEFWNGAVVRLGRESGIPTPVHEAIYSFLRPQELRARGEVTFPS